MKEGENMGIVAFEGASAVGKSTTCRELEKITVHLLYLKLIYYLKDQKMNIEHGILKNK